MPNVRLLSVQTSSRLSAPCSAARCSRQGLCTEMVVSIPTMNYSQKPGLWICEGRSFRVHVSLGMFRSTSIAAYQASPALPPSFSPSRKAREAAIERVVKRSDNFEGCSHGNVDTANSAIMHRCSPAPAVDSDQRRM